MLCKVKDSNPDRRMIPEPHKIMTADGFLKVDLNDDRCRQWDGFLKRSNIFYEGWEKNFGQAQDSTEGFAFQLGELTYLETKAIAKWYDPEMYETLLGPCIDTSAGAWAKSIVYKSIKQAGIGAFVGPDARSFPMVDIGQQLATIGVGTGQIGYQYSQEDLLMAAHLKQALPDDFQSACQQAYKRHANSVALLGDTSKNFLGLYNNTNATAANRLSGAVWDSATADVIVADIIDSYGKYVSGTANNTKPSKFVVPLTTYSKLLTPRSTNSDTTIKKFIEETLQVTIEQDILLDLTANGGTSPGSGSTRRCVWLNPKNDNMVFHIPQPLTFLAPQFDGVWIVVPAMYKIGGYELRRIQTVRYMDGV